MKIGPWRLALERFVIPELPGRWWVGRSGALVREPADWLLCAVAPWTGRTPGANALVQLLAAPFGHLNLNLSQRLGDRRPELFELAEAPRTAAECEPYGALLLRLIREDALPLFERHGTLEGYLAYLESRVGDLADRTGQGWLDINVDEARCDS